MTFLTRAALLCLNLLAMPLVAQGRGLDAQLLDEINLARTAPRDYARYLKEFRHLFRGKNYTLPDRQTQVTTSEGVAAVDEAIRFLIRQKPLAPLVWSHDLAAAARELAKEQAETGATGHEGKSSGSMRIRIERQGSWQGEIAENIGYGPGEARNMAMQLIIDDGVPNRGHRHNIFNKRFHIAGVACGPHPLFESMCVIDFAGGFSD